MSAIQLANVMKALRQRSENHIRQGGDGFVSTAVLRFDVGLGTRPLRRVLDEAFTSGGLERREDGRGSGYSYRFSLERH